MIGATRMRGFAPDFEIATITAQGRSFVFHRVAAFTSSRADALLVDDVLDVAAAGLSCVPDAALAAGQY